MINNRRRLYCERNCERKYVTYFGKQLFPITESSAPSASSPVIEPQMGKSFSHSPSLSLVFCSQSSEHSRF